MRRWMTVLLMLMMVSPARGEKPGEPHDLHVQTDRASTLRWVVTAAGEAPQTFIDERQDLNHFIVVRRGSDGRLPAIVVEASAPGGLFTKYEARWSSAAKELHYEKTRGLDEDVASLTLEPSLIWPRIWTVILSPVVALGLVFWIFRRRMRRRLRRADETLAATRDQLTEAQLRQGLFPSDGSLPRTIGDYAVRARLGAGGMAVVYRVQNSRGEEYALKLPLPTCLQDDEFKRRFRRELRIGVRMLHPSLVRIVDVNGGEEGEKYPYPFLVMELVRGQTLQDYLAGGVEMVDALAIASQILDALAYIHRNGVIHRDIKPSNVMLTDQGRTKVMDFGVAHRDDTVARLTGTGDVLGTAAYMAPEQIEGGTVDARTDLYALGVMVYEMLAGQLPYGNDSMQILYQKMHEELPPLCDANPRIPALVEQWLDGLLARHPDDRWPSADEALQALAQVMDALGIRRHGDA